MRQLEHSQPQIIKEAQAGQILLEGISVLEKKDHRMLPFALGLEDIRRRGSADHDVGITGHRLIPLRDASRAVFKLSYNWFCKSMYAFQ